MCSKIRKTTKQFIEEAENTHNNYYDYSLVDYQGIKQKVIIICPIHGDFEQTPYCHINRKQGCPNLAYFDSRVFQIPELEEVVNCLIWRQRDAEKNSIAMLAQSLYSHKELFKKNGSDMQEMCFQKGHNWNDLHWSKKRGSFIVKTTTLIGVIVDFSNSMKTEDTGFERSIWEVVETPIFSQDRDSILRLISVKR